MIIFNLWAIVVVPLIYLICLPFYKYFPDLMKGPHEVLIVGIIAAVVGGITDLVGIKGRLFLLPIWLIGIGMVCYHVGTVGMIIFGVIATIGIYLLIKRGRKESAEAWKKAQEELVKNPAPEAGWDEIRFWEWIKATLFLPFFGQTPEVRAHNVKVLDGLIQAKPALSKEEVTNFILYKKFLEASKDDTKSAMPDNKLVDALRELADKKLDLLKKNAAKAERAKAA
ncbi:MAG: hypothetical protein JWQ71_2088 [Pedosphaera sp.]|nr:hypothetical protein [Pedosphaera sp.]